MNATHFWRAGATQLLNIADTGCLFFFLHSLVIQWNPSIVAAIGKRLLTRICSRRASLVERAARRALWRARRRAKRLSFSSAVSEARRSFRRARILASRLSRASALSEATREEATAWLLDGGASFWAVATVGHCVSIAVGTQRRELSLWTMQRTVVKFCEISWVVLI